MLILVTPDSNLAHFPLCLNHKSQQSPVLFSRPRSTCNFCFSRSVHRPSVLYGNVIFGVIDPRVHHNVFFIRLKLEHYSFSLQILFGTFLCSGVPWNICEIRAMAKRATLLQFFFSYSSKKVCPMTRHYDSAHLADLKLCRFLSLGKKKSSSASNPVLGWAENECYYQESGCAFLFLCSSGVRGWKQSLQKRFIPGFSMTPWNIFTIRSCYQVLLRQNWAKGPLEGVKKKRNSINEKW